jgi:hypothetical protein
MSIVRPSRRGLITGLISLMAAPAIMRVAPIMPIRVNREAAILALIAERIAKTEVELARQFEERFFGGYGYYTEGLGLGRLLEKSANLEHHVASIKCDGHGG